MEEYEQQPENDGDDSDAEMMAGADFVRPGISPEAREFVTKAREMIYDEKFTPILQQALTGGQDLVSGVAPIVAQVILQAENKLGPLSDEDLEDVVIALSGTFASTAKMLGDPDAEDIADTAHEIAEQVIEIMHHQGGDEQAPAEGEQMPPDAQAPQVPPQGMAAMQPQGPPQMGPPQ